MSEKVEIKMPAESQEGTRSMVSKWLKNVGDQVKEHEPILELNTDKVSVEIASPASGILLETFKNENDEVTPGEILGVISTGDIATAPKASAPTLNAPSVSASAASSSDMELSPAVKKLLKEHGLAPEQVKGSGRGGRITHQDVMDHISKDRTGSAKSRTVKHSAMRKEIATHMSQSLLHTAPHVTSVFEAELDNVLKHREKNKAAFQAKGVALTLTSYFVQACVKALSAVPEVNSRWYDDRLEIYDDCNIGIATALESGGLIVPVIERAQELDLLGTAQRLQELTDKARSNSLQPAEVRNGTFTISNHGVSGSLFAAPIIINQPQSAILGIGKLEKRVVAVEHAGKSNFESRSKLYVTLTIDHRVLDGFQANKFLGTFVTELSNY